MGRFSCKQLFNNFSMVAMIDRSQPQFIRLSSSIRVSHCSPKTNKHEIPSTSLFDGFIKTTRSMSRFYKRTFSEYVPSSMLVRPYQSYETDEAVHYLIGMCGIADNDVKVSVQNNKSVTIIGEGGGVFEATQGFKKYVCYIDLPDIDSPHKMYTTRGIKANMMFSTAMVEIIIPKLKKPDDENEKTINNNNVKLNRTYYEDIYGDDEDNYEDVDEEDEEEDDGCKCEGQHNNVNLTRLYDCVRKLYLYSIIKVVSFSRLPLIHRCVVISSRALAAAAKRCSISITINDGSYGYRLMHNLQRARNVTVYRISNFIYTNVMNRFGLVTDRAFSIGITKIKASPHETDECLYYYLQMNGVISHEKVSVFVDHNLLQVKAVVFDEFKATHHMYYNYIKLPEDSYYFNYKMRDIKAEFISEGGGGELKLSIPKLNAAERLMMNENKDEILKLKEDAFIFDIKVTEKNDEAGEYVAASCRNIFYNNYPSL